MKFSHPNRTESKRRRLHAAAPCAALIAVALAFQPTSGARAEVPNIDGPCEETAGLQFRACGYEARDDFFVTQATCTQIEDDGERTSCRADAAVARREGLALCAEQRAAREDLCDALGQGRYDANFDPALFERNPANPSQPNPYFPLEIGSIWDYSGFGETVRREVLDATKEIEGVNCLVLIDRVLVAGLIHEDTEDWYGLRLDGSVDYCGESVRDFQFFGGDRPQRAELVAIGGSFKAGRDGAQAGSQMPAPAALRVGMTYRQEWAPNNAEDAALLRSKTYRYGRNPALDAFVPRNLAERLCAAGDCLVFDEFSPIDPGVIGRKYYARGIGFFLEVKPASGAVVQLVGCNFDARCASLPPN